VSRFVYISFLLTSFLERGITTMTNFRMMLLSTAAIGLTTAAAVSTSYAADVEKKVSLSGFVNRAIISGDDGVNNFISHTNPGGIGQSRVKLKGEAKSEAMTVQAYIELRTSAGTDATQLANGSSAVSMRHSKITISNSMGSVIMGHTAHAGEAIIAIDNSGTNLASNLNASPYDAVLFKDTSTASDAVAAGSTVAAAHGGDYSGGRASGITYATPKFNGFNAQISNVTKDNQYGIKYGGDFNGVKVTAAYSYSSVGNPATGGVASRDGGGLGIELPSGFNVSSSYRSEKRADNSSADDGDNWTTKVGYKMKGLTDLGGTNLAVMYKKAENAATTGDKYEEMSFLVQQSLSDYGTSVYGGFTNMSFDTTASNFDDINGVCFGALVNF
jgi:hypothetical protein